MTDSTPTIDVQVHSYERNSEARPWLGHLDGPDEVTGDDMVAAMDDVGVDGALLVSPFSMYGYDPSYAVQVYEAHPTRFALIKPFDPESESVSDEIALWAHTKGVVGARLMLKSTPYRSDHPGVNQILSAASTEGIPLKDMILTRHRMSGKSSVLLGPNCPGIITPDQLKIGIMPGYIHQKGSIGVVSRSGTLTYEVVHQLSQQNLGQSTCVGIGGDPINGLKHLDVIRLFNEDPDTDAVVLCGEIGGSDEEDCAAWVKDHMSKPVVGFIAGSSAPPGKRMGHAGAIVADGKGTAEAKMAALEDAGVFLVRNPAEIGSTMKQALKL